MFYKVLIFISFFSCSFAAKVPESKRIECALKIHRGFALQSVGQSTAAFFAFNEGYQEALIAGVSPKKVYALGNLFNWYRKYGHYLGIFLENPAGNNVITDEYRGKSSFSPKLHGPKSDINDRLETAALSRDMIFGFSQMIGGVLGAIYIPEITMRGGALMLAGYGVERFWNAFTRLKTKNDLIAYETKKILEQIQAAAEEEEW